MALMQCNFHSDVLGMGCQMNVIVPQPATKTLIGMNSTATARKDNRVLYLLHGCSDDYSVWERRTSIERYVAGQDLVVVMPSVARSYYTDMVYGPKYWTFISEELPQIVQTLFPVSKRPEDTYVAGLSMGGYGTLKLLMNYPDRYAGGVALSAVTDLSTSRQWNEAEWNLIFGSLEQMTGSLNDLWAMSAKLAADASKPRPKIFQCCGTEDVLYRDNCRFSEYLQKLGLEHQFKEYPGNHNWEFWDSHIVEGLKYIGAIR